MVNDRADDNRRSFLKGAALAGSIALATGSLQEAMAQAAPDWKNQIGLELYTVRDVMEKDYDGVLAKIASFGYKEVEPANGYNNMSPKDWRAMLDRHGLSAPSTHSGPPPGDTVEARLEGAQIMGFKYITTLGASSAARAAAPAAPRPATPAGQGRTTEMIKRQAQTLNENGKVAQKFGMKMIVHNHTQEFAVLSDNANMRPYDILLAETDPAVVAMQLDIGWASVAGQDILGMFKKHPGRFECWHVKDATDIRYLPVQMSMTDRQRAAYLVPVGQGQVDYKAIFAQAKQAGMKHFCIEQDNASAWGDSVLAAKASIEGLKKALS
jgi:sugar phosphate isomerase/epimerase